MLFAHLATLESRLLADAGLCRAAFVQQFVEPVFGGDLRVERGGIS